MREYVPLATGLRPRRWEDVLYHESVTLVLKSMLYKNNIPNSILLSGIRGVGKTSIARLFSRALNCKFLDENQNPCNECESCKMSLAGNHPDIMEISGSTNGNIEDIRKLMDHAMLSPIAGRWKVFIIDEIQGLARSGASFDALLKVLEEPPTHVVWLFCTTAKNRLPDTIKSRLVSLDLKCVPTSTIADYVLKIIKKQIKLQDIKKKIVNPDSLIEVAEVVAFASKNSIRDALTLLEKVIPYCKEKGWTKEAAYFSIGSMESSKTFALLQCISSKDSKGLWNTLQEILESGTDADTLFNDGIVEAISNLFLVSSGGQPLYADEYLKSFQTIGTARLIYIADVVAKRTEQFNASNNKKFMLQLLTMELCL